jgi:D-alanyl-lipoteichoic acid acyltransferase DltB (MBOAT superfamily)
MLLSTSSYFVFLVGIFFIYWPVSRFRTLVLSLILFANYFFLTKWGLLYLFLIPAASLTDFLIGLGLERWPGKRTRRLLISASVALNLGLLASMKYLPFFAANYSALFGGPSPAWSWAGALGLSFYAFQSLTYTIDIYRRDLKATRSVLAHLAAVSFFPTMLAGPITRVGQLLPQWEKPKILSSDDGGKALFLIGTGLAKKLLIADYLAENLVNRVFDLPKLYSSFEVLIAVYGYALQLYYDFSGYSDIAIGSALLLGIRLPVNFNQPYAARNIADFWRRWHISLSNWLRDYLYFSFPGLRSTNKVWPYGALILTMVLGGIWHGASWSFAVWGLLHGVGLALHRLWQTRKTEDGRSPHWWAAPVSSFVTVQFVCFAWIFFRAGSLANAGVILGRLASLTFSTVNLSAGFVIVLVLAAAVHYAPRKWDERCREFYAATPFYAQAAAMLLLVIAIEYIAQSGAAPFIYTKF